MPGKFILSVETMFWSAVLRRGVEGGWAPGFIGLLTALEHSGAVLDDGTWRIPVGVHACTSMPDCFWHEFGVNLDQWQPWLPQPFLAPMGG